MDKIAAVIGSGPCSKDIQDFDALKEARYTVVINAANTKYGGHVVALHHYLSFQEWYACLQPDQLLLCGTAMIERMDKAKWHSKAYKARQAHGNNDTYTAYGVPEDMTLPHVLVWLRRAKGYQNIELYGIDHNNPRYVPISQFIVRVAKQHGINIVNCCPSSLFPEWGGKEFPIEERPWTSKTALPSSVTGPA